MITTLKIIFIAILFVVTSGAIFREYFRQRRFIQFLAGAVALISSWYLWLSIEKDLFSQEEVSSAVSHLGDEAQIQSYGEKPEQNPNFRNEKNQHGLVVPTLTYHGYGEVRFGYSLTDTERVVGEKVFSRKGWRGGGDTCYHVEFSRYPGVIFMVVKGIVTRADVEVGVANILGVRVGDDSDLLKRKIPLTKIKRHKYDTKGHYFIVESRRPGYAIVLEESRGRITSIRAGTEPSVHWVEHCL